MAAGEEEAAMAFVETSLGTGLVVSFPASATTVAHLKRIVSAEHAATFPNISRIAVESFKVRRRGSWYHLSDSVAVRAAFRGIKGACWHLQADVVLLPHSAAPPGPGPSNVLHHVLCSSQQNAIGDAASSPSSGARSTNQEDGHDHHLGIGGDASQMAPHVTGGASLAKCRTAEGGGGYGFPRENSEPHKEDGHDHHLGGNAYAMAPHVTRGASLGKRSSAEGVAYHIRGENSEHRDDSALTPRVTRASLSKRSSVIEGANSDPHAQAHGDGHSSLRAQQQRESVIKEEPRGRKHSREEEDGGHDQSVLADCDAPDGSLAAIVCSIGQDDQNKCRDQSTPKRICAAREDVLLNEVDNNSVGGSNDVIVLSSDDEMLEDSEATDFDNSCCQDEGLNSVEKKKEGAVLTSPADHAEPSVELFDHRSDPLLHDLDETLEEVDSFEKEVMARTVKGKEPWTAKVQRRKKQQRN